MTTHKHARKEFLSELILMNATYRCNNKVAEFSII